MLAFHCAAVCVYTHRVISSLRVALNRFIRVNYALCMYAGTVTRLKPLHRTLIPVYKHSHMFS
jgi:hypothetical protein